MKKGSIIMMLIYCSLFLTSCNTRAPREYFDIAVLNSNYIAGFGGSGISRELESPSAILGENGQPIPMKRQQVIDDKIQFCESALSKIKSLSETEDSKDILESAHDLYAFVLPVYQEEYTVLARLYDDAAPTDQVIKMDAAIKEKYAAKFEEMYNDLINKGKLYADKHKIPVNWAN